MRTRAVRVRFAAVVGVAALAMAACGDDDGGGDASPGTTASGSATTSASTGSTGGTGTTGGGGGGAAECTGTPEASDTGITAETYKIGIVASLTGSAAPLFEPTVRAAQARVDLANAEGGICGRQIQLVEADDASNPQQNLSASQSLVQQQNVFMVLNPTPFAFGGYRYLQEQGVPVVGGCFDGPEWFQEPNTNMVCNVGNSHPDRPEYTTTAQFMKDQGATKVAALGYGSSPSSAKAAENFHNHAAPAVGLDPVYLNTSLAFGTVDVSSVVLDLRNRQVDGISLPLIQNSNFAVVTGGAQAGIDWKAAVMATGYGQSLLDQPTAVAVAETPGVFMQSQFRPVEEPNEGTERMQAAFAEYADFDGVPDYAWYEGWLSADLAIDGLLAAGVNPTRESYLDALHGLGTWDGNGVLARAVDISLEGFGTPQPETCSWFMKVENGEFVSATGPDPVCGPLIEDSVA